MALEQFSRHGRTGAASPFLTVAWVLSHFGAELGAARRGYRAFVAAGLGREPWAEVRAQTYLGGEAFLRDLTEPPRPVEEVPRAHWNPIRAPLADLFRAHGREAIELAYREHGYRLREIAEHLGVHYATVSRRLRQLERARLAP